MDVKGKVLFQLFNKSKLSNGTKTYLEQKFSLSIVKFKKLGFSVPLMLRKAFMRKAYKSVSKVNRAGPTLRIFFSRMNQYVFVSVILLQNRTVCLRIYCQAESPQRVDYLVPRWEMWH